MLTGLFLQGYTVITRGFIAQNVNLSLVTCMLEFYFCHNWERTGTLYQILLSSFTKGWY